MNRNPSTKLRLFLANDSPMVAAVEAGHTTFAPEDENEEIFVKFGLPRNSDSIS